MQSDDTDTTAANEDEGLQQQPNNTRLTAPKAKRELGLSDKARCVCVGWMDGYVIFITPTILYLHNKSRKILHS